MKFVLETFMILNEVSSAHQECLFDQKYSNIVKYYNLNNWFLFKYI